MSKSADSLALNNTFFSEHLPFVPAVTDHVQDSNLPSDPLVFKQFEIIYMNVCISTDHSCQMATCSD